MQHCVAVHSKAAERHKNRTVLAPEIFLFMNMASAPATERFVLMRPASIPELTCFIIRLLLRPLFVFTH